MAISGGNWTGAAGNLPTNFSHPAAPKALTAVAPRASELKGNYTFRPGVANPAVGLPRPEPVSIDVGGEDLLAVIADLRARLDALENPTP